MSYPVLPHGLLGSTGGGEDDTYQVERSLRFNSADSAYLSRTATTSTNRKTWTWSGWVKRTNFTTLGYLFASNLGPTYTTLGFYGHADNSLAFDLESGLSGLGIQTSQLFRDPSAWYHIVAYLDTTQATQANRMKLYVNGVGVTALSRALYPPTQNSDYFINNNASHVIGCGPTVVNFFNGYMAEVNFVDGQALTPSSFGETDAITGRWKAKAYTGTYGTNGFYLKFADNSGTTSTTLGKDSSPNGNNWTPNNFGVGGTQPALYSSPNLYTNAADVIANGTPLFSGSTFSSVYVYLVTNGGGDVGSKVFIEDGSGTIGGSAWTWLHRIGGSWTSAGGYNNTEWDLFTWGSQAVATSYIMNNSAPLHMLVPSAGSPQTVSGTVATFNSTPNYNYAAGNDSLVDSPTNYGTDTRLGGEVRGNYPILNPLQSSATISNGNLAATGAATTAWRSAIASMAVSTGKYYYEVQINTLSNSAYLIPGVGNIEKLTPTNLAAGNGYPGQTADSWGVQFAASTNKYNGTGTLIGSVLFVVGDILQVAFDVTAGTSTGKFWVGKNNVWLESGNPSAGTSPLFSNLTGTIAPYVGVNSSAESFSANFGQRPFAYTAPTGFKALCSTNLPTPTIKKPSSYMDVVTYNGNTSTQTISGLGFSPDLVWLKSRSTSTNHYLIDSVRGASKNLYSNSTAAEASSGSILTSFNSNGFSLGPDIEVNGLTRTYVAWAWDKSPIAGMDIVSYSGTGVIRTVPHNLGVPPKMIICKKRGAAGNWIVGHSSMTSWSYYMLLNTTTAQTSNVTVFSSAPTSSVFSLGIDTDANGTGTVNIAYLFAEVEGFSKFGSYTGNGSADGPFIYCGFRPRWVLFKESSASGNNWNIYDTSRDTANPEALQLKASTLDAEGSNTFADYTSNGFKLRVSTAGINSSGQTYIFAAFAEQPFKYARAR